MRHQVALPSGETVVVLGQGTWAMGEDRRRRAAELAALRLGLDLGMMLVDTAEMYANGGAEEVVGEAISGRIAPSETLEAFQSLTQLGDIRYWGVSNFDISDMEELVETPGGRSVATNHVLYNLARSGIEFDLLPWCQARQIPIMAYSPIDQRGLLGNAALGRVAVRRHATPAQVAIAWVLRQPGVVTIPKSANAEHVRENRAALDVHLTQEDLHDLDREFPPPSRKVPLELL